MRYERVLLMVTAIIVIILLVNTAQADPMQGYYVPSIETGQPEFEYVPTHNPTYTQDYDDMRSTP